MHIHNSRHAIITAFIKSQRLRHFAGFVFGVMVIVVSMAAFNVSAFEMLAEIDEEVATEFGVYKPDLVEVVPSVSPYVVATDFSNVVNFDQFTFTEAERALLLQNGFVATPSTFKEMYDVYHDAKEADLPIFVSVDAPLHAYHVLFDYVLRTLETEKFSASLSDLTLALLVASQT